MYPQAVIGGAASLPAGNAPGAPYALYRCVNLISSSEVHSAELCQFLPAREKRMCWPCLSPRVTGFGMKKDMARRDVI